MLCLEYAHSHDALQAFELAFHLGNRISHVGDEMERGIIFSGRPASLTAAADARELSWKISLP